MSSLEVRTPVQLQLRRVVLTKPNYTPLPKLNWFPIIPNYACAEKPPIIPKIMLA